MKLREEIETVVGDGETLLRCLEQLGYACGSATRSIAKNTRSTT